MFLLQQLQLTTQPHKPSNPLSLKCRPQLPLKRLVMALSWAVAYATMVRAVTVIRERKWICGMNVWVVKVGWLRICSIGSMLIIVPFLI